MSRMRSTATLARAAVAVLALAAAPVAGKALDNGFFATVLPESWEVAADDLAGMGMMTLAEKGSGGARGIYVKFEGSGAWTGSPAEEIASFAKSQNGSPAKKMVINGIEYHATTYEAWGTRQTMMVTKHKGTKVTLTVLGDGYGQSPAVTSILDAFRLK